MGQATVDAALRPSDAAICAAVARLDAQLAAPRIESANSHTPDYTSPKWEWPSTAHRCYWCRRSSVQLLYTVRTRPTFTYGEDGPTGGTRVLSAVCFDSADCDAHQARKRELSDRRRGVTFILQEPPLEGKWRGRGFCRWCGDAIVLKDPSEYRRLAREYHRGDQFEEGDRNCQHEWWGSYTSEGRFAVVARDIRDHDRVFCAGCGVVCVEKAEGDHAWSRFGQVHELATWEADHRIPLEDGGAHALDNLQCLCVDCHRAKTGRENRERAERRANLREDAPQPPPRPDRRRERAPSPF